MVWIIKTMVGVSLSLFLYRPIATFLQLWFLQIVSWCRKSNRHCPLMTQRAIPAIPLWFRIGVSSIRFLYKDIQYNHHNGIRYSGNQACLNFTITGLKELTREAIILSVLLRDSMSLAGFLRCKYHYVHPIERLCASWLIENDGV